MPDKDLADNKAYAKAGGYRYELEQIRKMGQALSALEVQMQSRARSEDDRTTLLDLKHALNEQQAVTLASRKAAES